MTAAVTLLILPALQCWAAVATVTSSVFPAIPTYVDGVTGIVKFTPASGLAVPTGSVTYSVDGASTATAPLMNGTAYLNLTEFAVGLHTLNTSYSGDGVYQPSTQAPVQFTVVDQSFALAGIEGMTGYVGGLVFNVRGLATDSHDTLYEADHAENNVRALSIHAYDPVLLPLTGTVSPAALATDANDNLYIADDGNGNIYEYSSAGVQTTLPITGLSTPTGLAIDRARNLLYIADPGNQSIVRYDLTAGGALTSIVTGLTRLVGLSLDPAGTLYYSDGNAGYHHLDAAGNDTPLFFNASGNTTPGYVGGIFVDRKGLIYVSDTGYDALLRVDALGHQTRISTDDSQFQLADDSHGRIFSPLGGGYVNVIDPVDARAPDVSGDTNINGNANPSYSYATYALPQGVSSLSTTYAPPVNFTPFAGTAPTCSFVARWGTCNTQFLFLYTLPGIRVGNIVATYTSGPTLSTVLYGNAIGSAPAFAPGTQSTLPSTAQAVTGVGVDQLGNYYASDGTANKILKTGGGNTTALPFANLAHPTAIAVDGLAAVYVLDSGHNQITKLDSANHQTNPVVAGMSNPLTAISAFTLNGNAEIYFAGPAGAASSLYLLDRNGATTMIASGLGASVSLAIDPYNDLYLLQQDGSLLRFDENRVQATLAPAGTFTNPVGLGVDASGTAYVVQAAAAGVTLVHPDSTLASISIPVLIQGVGLALDGRGSILTADSSTNNFIFVDRSHQDFDFGTVPLNASTTFNAFLANSGDDSFAITGIPGDNTFQLVPTNACLSSPATTTIGAAATCNLSFTVHPTSVGTVSEGSRVTTTALDLGVDFETFTENAAAAPIPTLTPNTLAFSSTVGVASSAQQATLTNAGSAPLPVSSVAITGNGAVSFTQTNTCAASVAVGGSCTITILCTPNAVGTITAVLSVSYPAPLPQQSIALSCAASAALVPQATLAPAVADFSNVTVGMTSKAQTFTLSNTGTAALAVTAVSLGGSNPANFAIAGNTCDSSLAPGASCIVSVTFTPSSVGAASATLLVADAVGTQSSTLTGTGEAPAAPPADFAIAATPSTQTVSGGGAATYTINVVSSSGTFMQPVALAASGQPPGATISFSSNTVTPGAAGAASTMTIQTAEFSAASLNNKSGNALRAAPMLALLMIVPFGLRKRSVHRLWCFVAWTVVAGALQGCGGGFALPQTAVTGPSAPRTYTVTVTGTSGSTQHSTVVQISLQG